MSETPRTPFDTIESAQEFIDLLLEAIEETRRDVSAEIRLSGADQQRRIEALQLVALNLNKLATHITKSRRILNDLRTLRRLLLQERRSAQSLQESVSSQAAGAA